MGAVIECRAVDFLVGVLVLVSVLDSHRAGAVVGAASHFLSAVVGAAPHFLSAVVTAISSTPPTHTLGASRLARDDLKLIFFLIATDDDVRMRHRKIGCVTRA
ncbi:hypothetical protein V502_06606 [Pseudogymnoascus sp. VKM F-4520 (FW-2644)]|nr:hypothetical protein V502_06606 [Pseudogymnoascus sp. VKM F-4520 (FW-2644)]